MNVDYLIIGQGICGTLLSRELMRAGATVLVMDAAAPNTASRMASGVINPVTGKRLVRTWLYEEALPVSLNTYNELEKELDITICRPCDILHLHPDREAANVFEKRLEEDAEYLHRARDGGWDSFFRYHFGAGEIANCYLVDMRVMLQRWREMLAAQNIFREAIFSWDECAVSGAGIAYRDIVAKKIICCEGAAGGDDNPYFAKLPFAKNKGEALIVSIPDLPRTHIYKGAFSLVPWSDNLFWFGASYEWHFADAQPSEAFYSKAVAALNNWLKIPFTIVDHLAAERPTTIERKPFAGLHPAHPAVGIFNGMGTKGCSLAPYFAQQLAQYLLHQQPMDAAVDVRRYARILTR